MRSIQSNEINSRYIHTKINFQTWFIELVTPEIERGTSSNLNQNQNMDYQMPPSLSRKCERGYVQYLHEPQFRTFDVGSTAWFSLHLIVLIAQSVR